MRFAVCALTENV